MFEGEMDGRPVAVKRLLRQFYDLAHKEIGALILSDEHPNVVRSVGCLAGRPPSWLAVSTVLCRCSSQWAMT